MWCCDLGGWAVIQCMHRAPARRLCTMPSPGKAERVGGAAIAVVALGFWDQAAEQWPQLII